MAADPSPFRFLTSSTHRNQSATITAATDDPSADVEVVLYTGSKGELVVQIDATSAKQVRPIRVNVNDGELAEVQQGGERIVLPAHWREFITPDRSADPVLYQKCLHCHLFVEVNKAAEDMAPGEFAVYMHLHRGDDVDDVLDASHEATPSGRFANLLTWKTYGPEAMRERFTD